MSNQIKVIMKKIIHIIVAILILLIMLILFIPLLSIYLKRPMYLSAYSSAIALQYSTQLFITGFLMFIICILFYKYGRYLKKLFWVNLLLSLFVFIGFSVLEFILFSTARKYDAKVSFWKSIKKPEKTISAAETYTYCTILGQEYKIDMYPRKDTKDTLSIPIIAVHGGAFIEGNRTQLGYAPNLLTEHGYTVFSVDYPLATDQLHTWEIATNAIATAINYIQKHAKQFNINPKKYILVGGSAGAALVMQTDLGIRNGFVNTYDTIIPSPPDAVIALYPPVNLSVLYQNMVDGSNVDLRYALKKYIGGFPNEYPNRYAQVDLTNHLNAGMSPTIILAGSVDHVVNIQATRSFVNKAESLKLPITYVEIPYGEHVFDANPNSIAGQIVVDKIVSFLKNYKLQ